MVTNETSPLNGSEPNVKENKSSKWMDRLITCLVTLGVVAAILLVTTTGSSSSTATEETTAADAEEITYRPMCKINGNNNGGYSSVKVLQTSMDKPTEKWAPQECLKSSSSANDDVNRYGAPDAVLQVDLSKHALPDRPAILGFGGAFTEASALNFNSLSHEGQEAVLQLLFGDLGYSLGRVHINSCDFSVTSYAYDDVDGDFDLEHFSIQHDVDSGMIDFMVRAKQVFQDNWSNSDSSEDEEQFKLYASPWSPPAWMKAPTPDDFDNATHALTMTNSAQPVCVRDGVGPDSPYAKAWALYFTKFLQSYQDAAGLEFFAITIQNEPEFPAPWEACSYTPTTQADFLANHLGPQMKEAFPNTKILIFDHNKDHAPVWINELLSNPASAPFVSGTAYHWYAGGMDRLLDGAQGTPNMHRVMSQLSHNKEHVVLGSEACHCPYTGYAGGDVAVAWYRAERYAHTMLADLAAGSQGWVEWNLILDSIGGPNHLGNLCDASLLAVPHRAATASPDVNPRASFEHADSQSRFGPVVGDGRTREELHALGFPANLLDQGVVAQPIFYYMGHISRHVRPGSRPVPASVEQVPFTKSNGNSQTFRTKEGIAGGGMNNLARDGIELTVWPCEGSTRQQFQISNDDDTSHQIQVLGHDWLGAPTKSCIRNKNDKDFLGVMTGTCNTTLGVTGAFDIIQSSSDNNDSVEIVVTNAKHHDNNKKKSCLIVRELANGGGGNGLRSGSQVAIGDCNADGGASLWKVNDETGEITSAYFGGNEVCMTTGWPFLQIGAFDTPTAPDAKKAVVILNEAGQSANYVLQDKDSVVIMTGSIPGHSIQTVLLD